MPLSMGVAMPKLTRLLLLTLAFAGLASFGRAQVLTADTITGFTASTAYSNSIGLIPLAAVTQTFTMPASGVNAIDLLTFRFITQDTNTFGATSLDTYFSIWNTSNQSAAIQVGPMGAIALADYTSWTNSGDGYLYYDATVDLSAYASGLLASTTYGFSILGNATTQSGVVKLAGGSTDYTDGGYVSQFGVTDFSTLSSVMGGGSSSDFAFTATLAPVPETSSVAVVLAALFVAGLVTMRLRQRNRLAAAAAVEA